MSLGNFAKDDSRELLLSVVPRWAGEYLGPYFVRAARKIGISTRAVRCAWQRELCPNSKIHLILRERARHVEIAPATELAALKERIAVLEKRLETTDAEFHSLTVATLRTLRAQSG